MGCHALLQGIFPTQGSNPHLLHWQVATSATREALWHRTSQQLKIRELVPVYGLVLLQSLSALGQVWSPLPTVSSPNNKHQYTKGTFICEQLLFALQSQNVVT